MWHKYKFYIIGTLVLLLGVGIYFFTRNKEEKASDKTKGDKSKDDKDTPSVKSENGDPEKAKNLNLSLTSLGGGRGNSSESFAINKALGMAAYN